MKKALALCAFALVMALPLVSSASSISSTFLTSSSGTSLLAASDTIQFEVTITTNAGQNYNTIFWSLTGDAAGALSGTPATWVTTAAHVVTNWEWNYTPPGGGKVKMGTNGRLTPFITPQPPPSSVSGPYGFFASSKTGDGIPALVGTVTIHANTAGVYQGGGYLYPGIDTFFGSAGEDAASVSTGSFTVVPEPGTALLMVLGLGGLGMMGRKSRK